MSAKKTKDTEYLYLSAMLKAREADMLTRDKLERMLAAGSFNDAAKLLQESGWPDMTDQTAAGVDKLLSQRREEIFAELERTIPEKEVVEVFRTKYDFHNAKAIVKGEGIGADAGHILSRAGSVTPAKLLEAFREDDFRDVPKLLGEAMAEAKGLLARTDNPQAADFLLDRAYFARLTELAGQVTSPYLGEYVRTLIDNANLRTVVRCYRMGKDPDFMRQALIDGGAVSMDFAVRGSVTADELSELFGSTVFKEAAVLGGAALEGGPMTQFEKACDNAVNAFLDRARRTGFGSEVAVGYLAAEENAITTVRMILTGLLSGIDPERLKERLRDTYV